MKEKVNTTWWYTYKYCTFIILDFFVCALLGFCARKFPAKYEKYWTFIIDQRSFIRGLLLYLVVFLFIYCFWHIPHTEVPVVPMSSPLPSLPLCVYATTIIPKPPYLLSHIYYATILSLFRRCLHIYLYTLPMPLFPWIYNIMLVLCHIHRRLCLPYPLSWISAAYMSSYHVSVAVLITFSSIILYPSTPFVSMLLNLCRVYTTNIYITNKYLPPPYSSNSPSTLPLSATLWVAFRVLLGQYLRFEYNDQVNPQGF